MYAYDSLGNASQDSRRGGPERLAAVAALLLAVYLLTRKWGPAEVSSEFEGKEILKRFASWEDWGGEEKPVKTLREALERERRAWEMTRQETCSWEAGDPPPQPTAWTPWPAKRCSKNAADCWDLLVSSCASSKCGSSWQEAHKTALQRLNISVDKASYPLDDVSLCGHSSGISRAWTIDEWEMAQAWFQKNVQVYVLEMPGFVISDEHETSSDLAAHGLQSERVTGLDLRASNDLKVALSAQVVPERYNVSLGEKAAASRAASHFRIQKLAAASKKPLALVLEDGVGLAHDFQQRVWSLIEEEIPCDWAVLSLSSSCPAGRCISPHLVRIGPDAERPRQERCKDMVSRGFRGILYRSAFVTDIQKRWMEAAFDAEHPECLSLDASLVALSDEVAFYAVPAVQSPGLLSC